MFRSHCILKYSLNGLFIKNSFQSTKFLASISSNFFCENNHLKQSIYFESQKNKGFFDKRDKRNLSAHNQDEAASRKTYQDYFFKKNEGTLTEIDYEDAFFAAYHLGLIAQNSGDLQKTEKYYKEALEIANTANFVQFSTLTVLNELGKFLSLQGRLDEALGYLNKGKILVENPKFMNAGYAVEKNILQRGIVFRKQGNDDAALEQFRKLIEMIKEDSEPEFLSLTVLPFLELGLIYSEGDDLQTAAETWEKGIKTIIQADLKHVERETQEIYRNLAYCYLDMTKGKERQKSLEYFQNYLSFAYLKEEKEILELFKFANKVYSFGIKSEAFQYCKQFLDLAENKPEFETYTSMANLILAILSLMEKNIPDSRNYFDLAISQCKKVFGPDGNEMLRHYLEFYQAVPNDRNIIKEQTENMTEIAEVCKEKMDIDRSSYLHFLFWTASSYSENKNWTGAIKYFEECLRLNGESVLNVDYLESLYGSISFAYFGLEKWDHAQLYAEKGIELCKQYDFGLELNEYKKLITKINDKKNPKGKKKSKSK